jgi:hypothetical protein
MRVAPYLCSHFYDLYLPYIGESPIRNLPYPQLWTIVTLMPHGGCCNAGECAISPFDKLHLVSIDILNQSQTL